MAHLLPISFLQMFDNSGNVEAGALCYVYEVGTTTLKNTYTTSSLGTANANPLVADSAGRFGAAYIADAGTYKVVIKSADGGTTFMTRDNLAAPPASANSAVDFPYESKSADYTLVAGDNNKFIDFDASGAARTCTADSSDMTSGYVITIGKSDSGSNVVTVTPGAGETIDGASSYVLYRQYETVTLVSMGASGWRVLARGAVEPLGQIEINEQTDSYTLVYSDRGKLVDMNKATANTLTVPTNASVPYPTGTRIEIRQKGAGETTIAAAGGVTIGSVSSYLDLVAQHSAAVLTKIATNTWWLAGDIEA